MSAGGLRLPGKAQLSSEENEAQVEDAQSTLCVLHQGVREPKQGMLQLLPCSFGLRQHSPSGTYLPIVP